MIVAGALLWNTYNDSDMGIIGVCLTMLGLVVETIVCTKILFKAFPEINEDAETPSCRFRLLVGILYPTVFIGGLVASAIMTFKTTGMNQIVCSVIAFVYGPALILFFTVKLCIRLCRDEPVESPIEVDESGSVYIEV